MTVGDVVAQTRIGRSSFYAQFASLDDPYLMDISPIYPGRMSMKPARLLEEAAKGFR